MFEPLVYMHRRGRKFQQLLEQEKDHPKTTAELNAIYRKATMETKGKFLIDWSAEIALVAWFIIILGS